jgi:hypothetical protein
MIRERQRRDRQGKQAGKYRGQPTVQTIRHQFSERERPTGLSL